MCVIKKLGYFDILYCIVYCMFMQSVLLYTCKLHSLTRLWCLCVGGLSHCEVSDDVEEHTDVSLITGKLRHTASRRSDDDDDKTSVPTDAVVKRDEQMTLVDNSAGMFCSVLNVLFSQCVA